jgi:cell division septation protein DedD
VVKDSGGERTVYRKFHRPGDHISETVSGEGPDAVACLFVVGLLVREKTFGKPGESVSDSSTGARYAVQVGIFSSVQGVRQLEDELRESGYPARTEVEAREGLTVYRVLSGSYPTEYSGRKAVEELRKQGYEGFLVERGPVAPEQTAADVSAEPQQRPKTATTRHYSVLVGVFSSIQGARQLEDELRESGYPARTEVEAREGLTVYRVLSGSYPTEYSGRKAVEELRKQGYEAFLLER